MANLITASRLLMLGVVVLVVYQAPGEWQGVGIPLLVMMFLSDGLDGYVARRRHETSQFGAMFDIASDRIVEITLWLVFADLGLVPVWVPAIFIVRGVIVDAIRSTRAISHRQSPFSTIRSSLGRFLVAGRTVRIVYAFLKAVTFCVLMFVHSAAGLTNDLPNQFESILHDLSNLLVSASVFVCVLRGMPVVFEYVLGRRQPPLISTNPSAASRHMG